MNLSDIKNSLEKIHAEKKAELNQISDRDLLLYTLQKVANLEIIIQEKTCKEN